MILFIDEGQAQLIDVVWLLIHRTQLRQIRQVVFFPFTFPSSFSGSRLGLEWITLSCRCRECRRGTHDDLRPVSVFIPHPNVFLTVVWQLLSKFHFFLSSRANWTSPFTGLRHPYFNIKLCGNRKNYLIYPKAWIILLIVFWSINKHLSSKCTRILSNFTTSRRKCSAKPNSETDQNGR